MSATIKKRPFISGLVESHLDVNVYQDILKTYAKETINFIDYGNVSITQVDPQTIARAQFTECEISPFRKNEIDCVSEKSLFVRQGSRHRFSEKKVTFSDIQTLLINSFSPSEKAGRPYPSAGGLYPVEPLVFLFEERIKAHAAIIDSGCYHFRPVSRKLQLIKKLSSDIFLKKLMHNFLDYSHPPAFCILYLAHIGKAIFKYRYRGYRHALMEAGSMYQQAMRVSQEMELSNTVWSTFSEHEMLYTLGLDYGTFMPLTMQLFGYDSHDK